MGTPCRGMILAFRWLKGRMLMLQWKPRLLMLLAIAALIAIALIGGYWDRFDFLEW